MLSMAFVTSSTKIGDSRVAPPPRSGSQLGKLGELPRPFEVEALRCPLGERVDIEGVTEFACYGL